MRGYWSASENSNIKSDENSELKAGEVRIPGERSRDYDRRQVAQRSEVHLTRSAMEGGGVEMPGIVVGRREPIKAASIAECARTTAAVSTEKRNDYFS